MLFNSFQFLLFFPAVTFLYFLFDHRYRWIILLLASCCFYMFFIPKYILILFLTILIDYAAGILIEKSPDEKVQKRWLILSLISNIGILVFFKYYGFLNGNVQAISNFVGWNYSLPALEIILPIGLSFHTFQAMSYTIEVYRGNQKAERHLGIYALYVMYYPQLVAGPIERPQNIIPQLRRKQVFSYINVTNGLKLMAWGLFKKIVVADRISQLISPVYDNPENYMGVSMLVAAVLFSFQIYADFSGYSDIALGASEVMGIKLMKNFDRPYLSRTISEFWRRWHISLSSWFRDYIYIPLGGSRTRKTRHVVNLLLIFLLSGLWHGANWTFIVWGALHGFYLAFAMGTGDLREKLRDSTGLNRMPVINRVLQTGTVFVLVTLAWVFFRAPTLGDATYMLSHIITAIPDYISAWRNVPGFLWAEPWVLNGDVTRLWYDMLVIILAIVVLETGHLLQRNGSARMWLAKQTATLRWSAYVFLCLVLLLFGVYHSNNEFIYFQF